MYVEMAYDIPYHRLESPWSDSLPAPSQRPQSDLFAEPWLAEEKKKETKLKMENEGGAMA